MPHPLQRTKRAGSGTFLHLALQACQRRFKPSRRVSLAAADGGGAAATGSAADSFTSIGGAGASQGCSEAKRIRLLISTYSRRTRCPSLFSMQIEKPG